MKCPVAPVSAMMGGVCMGAVGGGEEATGVVVGTIWWLGLMLGVAVPLD
jgi:hypothetical protein